MVDVVRLRALTGRLEELAAAARESIAPEMAEQA